MFSAVTPLEVNESQVKTIVIDAGHGGKDPGCSGKTSKESKVALSIALELGRIINENMPDVNVIYTRSTDKFVELHERAAIANKKGADLFVSIHCNASTSATPSGTETYVMGMHKNTANLNVAKRENSVILNEKKASDNYDGFDPKSDEAHIALAQFTSAHVSHSSFLASKIESQFKNRVNLKSHGVKQAGFLVLWKTAMPSVLVETGFLTNSKDEQYLNNKKNQILMASGIYRAIRDYKKEIEQ